MVILGVLALPHDAHGRATQLAEGTGGSHLELLGKEELDHDEKVIDDALIPRVVVRKVHKVGAPV